MEENIEYDPPPLQLALGMLELAHGMVPSGMTIQGNVISLVLSFPPSLEALFKLSDCSPAAPKMLE